MEKNLNNINDLHLITVVTEPKYYFKYLKESCKNNLKILGYGEKWQGFAWRFKLMIDYLKKLKPDDIVCFVDGYDVICVRELSELKNEFIKIKDREKCKIIIGLEIHSQITDKILAPILFGKCKNLSINCGTYIGFVNDILKILTETYNLNPDPKADDQLLITKYCNFNENNVYIDVNSEIFLTIVNMLDNIDNYIKIDSNKNVFYKNNKPFFIHGPNNTYLDNIIIKLGYDYDYNNMISESIKKDYLSKLFSQICNHIYQHHELIYIILLIIILIIIQIYRYRKVKNIK